MEGKLVEIIDIVSSSKMEHISTTGRGEASTTGAIPVHHILVGEGDDVGRGNVTNDSDNFIVSSSYSLYWGRTTKQTKEEILHRHLVCVKSKRCSKGSMERDIHRANAMNALLQTFGAVKYLVPKKSEGGSESTKYTDIQYEYVVNLATNKWLEALIMVYDMGDPFIIPTLVYEYDSAVEDC